MHGGRLAAARETGTLEAMESMARSRWLCIDAGEASRGRRLWRRRGMEIVIRIVRDIFFPCADYAAWGNFGGSAEFRLPNGLQPDKRRPLDFIMWDKSMVLPPSRFIRHNTKIRFYQELGTISINDLLEMLPTTSSPQSTCNLANDLFN